MGKQPSFQFYPNDWSRDLEEHPLEIEGAWIRICCKLWWAEERGKFTRTIDQWSRILRINNDEVMEIVNYIKEYKIGDVTVCNNLVTIINRRMYREYKERENTRLRVKRHREKQQSNANITPPSSSSSSSSASKKEKNKSVSDPKTGPKPYSIKVNDYFSTLDEESKDVWREAYPNVSLEDELRAAKAWLLSNPQNAKRNFRKFLNGWLGRAMERQPHQPKKSLAEMSPEEAMREAGIHE